MTSWSFSAYSTAVQCLRKFRYSYVDRLVPEGPESGDLIFGSALHSAINACLTGQDGAMTFEIYWTSYLNKEIEYGRFNWEQLAALGADFIRKFEKYHAKHYEHVFSEQRLYAEYNGVKLEGTPDFYGKYRGEFSLRDFKTSSRQYDADKALCALQLYLYAYLWRTNNPGSVIQTLGYTVFNKATGSIQDLTWKFSEAAMEAALGDLTTYADLFDRSEHYPRNLGACLDYNRRCQWFNKCHPKEEDNDRGQME